jgi:hypothetical protein
MDYFCSSAFFTVMRAHFRIKSRAASASQGLRTLHVERRILVFVKTVNGLSPFSFRFSLNPIKFSRGGVFGAGGGIRTLDELKEIPASAVNQ